MNQQAQVGKTTTAFNLAYALALMSQRVTLIDLDPESQLTKDCDLDTSIEGIDKVLLDGLILTATRVSLSEGLKVVPSGKSLITYGQQQQGGLSQGYQLKRAITHMEQQDFILIDCSAKSGLLTINALLAADEVLIPTKSNYASLQGLVRVIKLFKRLKLNSKRKKIWLALTQVTTPNGLAEEVKSKLLHYFPGRVLNTTIRYDKSLAECQRHKKAIFDYDQDGTGAEDYFSLAQDMIEGRAS
jgi:chromosome partitioning protein